MIYCTDDWTEIEESKLNDEILKETFVKDIHKTVYVSKGGAISGIVSHGDFCRHITDNTPLIQRRFMSCTLQMEEKAKEILHDKANIYGIPILDEEGRIIKEWRKKISEDDNGFSYKMIFRLHRQFMPDEKGGLNILVMNLSKKEYAKEAEKINEETRGKLLIIDRSDILNIKKYFEGVKQGIVYDFRQEYEGFFSIIYIKMGVKYKFLRKSDIKEDNISHILEFYGSVGILTGEEGGLSDKYKLEHKHQLCIFDDSKFVWNEVRNCAEYKENIEDGKVPEILWTQRCILKNPCVLYGDSVIPVISNEYTISEDYTYAAIKGVDNKALDYDIAYNVIPKLDENNIKYVIIFNSDNDYKQIRGFDIVEVERRATFIQSYFASLPNSFVNLDGGVTAQELYSELNNIQGWNKRGYKEFGDYKGKYITIGRGERLTLGNPDSYAHKIWLFGSCLVWGGFVDDASNMGSVLRKKLDNNYYIKNMGATYETRNLCIRDAALSEGDIVVIQAYDDAIYKNAGIKVYSLLDIYNECPNLMEHIIDMPSHADAYLIEKISERIYEILVSEHMLEDYKNEKKVAALPASVKKLRMRNERENISIPQGLKNWLVGLNQYKGETFSKTGAIVMNCNPFTLGHRYLIEQACGQVDKLLIFVLEEDKSFFKFEDRLAMVKLGTDDLDKVSVIPSGRYIISAETLPGYFEKEDNPEIVLDATGDLDFFAKVIAKELNISVRFAGEEPIDGYTRQYNKAMSKILPENYIDFVEIPRKEQCGSVISASRVRKLIKEKDYEGIKKLVLPQVYEYMEEHKLLFSSQ